MPLHPWRIDFVIGGAQKAGTTALYEHLKAHPEIHFDCKETHFFDDDAAFASPDPDYDAFHNRFDRSKPGVFGDATPIYMYWNAAPARLHRYNPAIKWIVVLRNPIERAYSQWNMERSRRLEPLEFRAALMAEQAFLDNTPGQQDRVRSYLDRGRYSEQVRRLWNLFGTGQVLVLRHETLLTQHESVLERICRFLGVGPLGPSAQVVANRIEYPEAISAADFDFCLQRLDPEISQLEALLGWDCGEWRLQKP
jgi:hypothetical protein